MEIEKITTISESEFADFQTLMKQLSDRLILSKDLLCEVIGNDNTHLYVMRDGARIIACASLCLYVSPSAQKASIEDVVVHSEYRGRHLGRILMEHVITDSKKYAPIELHLTSNPSRVAANQLYQSLGFQKKDTNTYQMVII